MKNCFKIFCCLLCNYSLLGGEFIPSNKDYIRINSQIQHIIAKTFTEDYFKIAEGFYDPRLGIVLILEYQGRIDCTQKNQEISLKEKELLIKECLREKIKRFQFIFEVRKLLKKQERLFLGIFSEDANRLEIWKKELLDKLDNSQEELYQLEPNSFLYLQNGVHPNLGKYPNWDLLEKIRLEILSKLNKMNYLSVNGIFIPAKGFLFIIKTKKIPIKKMVKFNKRVALELKKVENSGQFLIEYFYGGDRGELSNFIYIGDGSQSYLQYTVDLY